MKELKDYTDDELRNELKRRLSERKKNNTPIIQYVEFEATIDRVDNIHFEYMGKTKYKPFIFWKYTIKDWTTDVNIVKTEFYAKEGVFKRNNAPKVGDRVRLRYRKRKSQNELFDIEKAKIIEIV